MPRYSSTEQIGVHAVGHLFASEFGWIFREQPIADMGIDAHVERVDGDGPTGQLIGVQIKTGKSHFHPTESGLVYYGSPTHLDYWLGHALPVVLVAHLPETQETFWVQVTAEAVEPTSKGWKILIPKANVLDSLAYPALEAAFEGTPRQQRLRRLALDEGLMRHVQAGRKVSVELEHWYNKSLGRSTVQVYVYDGKGRETVEKEWFQYFVAPGMKELTEMLFPWATARVDKEFYDDNSEFGPSERDLLLRAMDEDHGIEPYEPGPDEVYPYADHAGEVASYRLRLFLNDLGDAYLRLSDYLDGAN